jgi:hypothetical protein
MLRQIDTQVTPSVVAIDGSVDEALADPSNCFVAPAFELKLNAGSEELTRHSLDAWWSAPERAERAGLVADNLPARWGTFWRQRCLENRWLVPPFIHRSRPVGKVKVWPGAVCFIRSAPKGSDSPWLIGVESALSMAQTDRVGGVVMVRQGLSPERAGRAMFSGQRTVPEQSFVYHSSANLRATIEHGYARSGWIFVILDQGRVLAVRLLQVEQPGTG